jgi:hypothetical protein
MGDDEKLSDQSETNVDLISTVDKAKIIGLEEIVEQLKLVNEKLEYNGSNLSILREEFNIYRDEIDIIQDNSEIQKRKISEHLLQIRGSTGLTAIVSGIQIGVLLLFLFAIFSIV